MSKCCIMKNKNVKIRLFFCFFNLKKTKQENRFNLERTKKRHAISQLFFLLSACETINKFYDHHM